MLNKKRNKVTKKITDNNQTKEKETSNKKEWPVEILKENRHYKYLE